MVIADLYRSYIFEILPDSKVLENNVIPIAFQVAGQSRFLQNEHNKILMKKKKAADVRLPSSRHPLPRLIHSYLSIFFLGSNEKT